MTTLFIFIHIFVCLFLIAVVLLQSGKGAEIGAAFGGSSQTLFGSRGAATFLSKMTTIAAVVFMITSLTLAVISAKGGSVLKKTPITEKRTETPLPPNSMTDKDVKSSQQQQLPQIPAQPQTK